MQPVKDRQIADWIEENARLHDVEIGAALTGGNANVTRLVTAQEGRFVLRHPPAETVSDKAAAGIEREYAALVALDGKAPVTPPIAFCKDAAVAGHPFSLTGFVEGVTITQELPETYSADAIAPLGFSLMETLGAIHSVDPAALLSQGFGRPEGFAERQVRRWLDVREKHSARPLPLLNEIGDWLLANLPDEAAPAIIHCDFHLDNCLSAVDRPEIRAAIDWEMATLGDPLVDLGLCLFFWKRDPDGVLGFAFVQGVSNRPEAPDRAAMADAWSRASGRDHTALPWYIVFSAWRLAAIVEGAFLLHVEGKATSDYARGLEEDVPNLLREAGALIEEAA